MPHLHSRNVAFVEFVRSSRTRCGMFAACWLAACGLPSGATLAAVETVTLNGATYDVETKEGLPLLATSADVAILYFGPAAKLVAGGPNTMHWFWRADVKRSGSFKVTVTTPLDATASTTFDVAAPGEASGEIFDSGRYPA